MLKVSFINCIIDICIVLFFILLCAAHNTLLSFIVFLDCLVFGLGKVLKKNLSKLFISVLQLHAHYYFRGEN